MIPRAVFRPQAEKELLEVRQWYEARAEGLGAEFGAAVDEMIARVLRHPLGYPRVHGEIRRAVLQRFPYAIYFRLLDDEIVVLAVHGRQHPARWQTRS